MKASCVREKLKNAVQLVERATGKNLSLAVLSSVLIVAEKDQLVLKATNLDIGTEVVVPAKVEAEGSVAVSGSVLGNFLGTVGDMHSITLESVNDNLYLSSEHHSTLLKSFPVGDFPTIPRITDGGSFEISADQFVLGLRSVLYSASLSDIKPEIASIYLYGDTKSAVFVATDSFRLAEKKVLVGDSAPTIPPVLIPLKNATEIARVFDGIKSDVLIVCNKNQISFSAEGVYLTSRLVSGTFPNYRQLLPASQKTLVSVEKKQLVASLKLAQIFSDKFNQVTFKVIPSDQLFEVGSRNTETGENTTKLEATFDGEEIEMHFNVKYILDCFQSMPEDTVSLRFNGPGRPMILQGAGNSSFVYLVMPMNK